MTRQDKLPRNEAMHIEDLHARKQESNKWATFHNICLKHSCCFHLLKSELT